MFLTPFTSLVLYTEPGCKYVQIYSPHYTYPSSEGDFCFLFWVDVKHR